MNIQTVAANLRNTIAGKEELLAEFESATLRNGASLEATHAMKEFLKLNIDELKRILVDVEVCCEQHSEMGWMINPERMGQ